MDLKCCFAEASVVLLVERKEEKKIQRKKIPEKDPKGISRKKKKKFEEEIGVALCRWVLTVKPETLIGYPVDILGCGVHTQWSPRG